jgi:mycothiol synthase
VVRVNEEWFDEKGFFVCEDKGKLIGFCWTKIHGAQTHSHEGNEADHGHEAIGEIYVLAVDPAYKGQGIGKNLTNTGLNYLKYQGLSSVMLYVGVENKAALNLYRSLGFSDFGSDVMYRVSK